MNDDARLERIFSDALAESAPSRAPDRLRADIKHTVSQTRPRPRWLATLREAPMHTLSTATVGSSTARRATAPPLRLAWLLLIALLALALVAGGLIVGSRLFQASAIPIPQGGAAVFAFDSKDDIFIVRADGTDLRQLTSGPGTRVAPDLVAGRHADRLPAPAGRHGRADGDGRRRSQRGHARRAASHRRHL